MYIGILILVLALVAVYGMIAACQLLDDELFNDEPDLENENYVD